MPGLCLVNDLLRKALLEGGKKKRQLNAVEVLLRHSTYGVIELSNLHSFLFARPVKKEVCFRKRDR